MKRYILFRGKRTDNGEWVEGYYSNLGGNSPRILKENIFIEKRGRVLEFENIKVLHETVGQYTGLTDKHGVKIFEGDIIRVEHDLWHGETKKTRESHIGVVFYNTKTAEFGAKIHGYSSCLRLRRWKGDFNEVIGNIHDNPELLEGGENNET